MPACLAVTISAARRTPGRGPRSRTPADVSREPGGASRGRRCRARPPGRAPARRLRPCCGRRVQREHRACAEGRSRDLHRLVRRAGRAALPASPDTIAAFVDAMAATRAPATVRRYVASFAVAHRAIVRAKTPRSPVVKLALQRMRRGKGRRQAQALGLTLHEIPPPGLGPDGTITVAAEILIRSRRRARSHPPGQSTFYVRSSGFWRFLRSCEKPSFFSMLWQCTNCRPLPGLHPGRGEIQLLTTTGPSGPFRRNSEPRPAAPIPPNLPPRIGGLLRR